MDSIEDIASSMNKVLESLQLPTHKIEDYKHFVGGGVDILVENALNNQSKEIKDEVIKDLKLSMMENYTQKTLPYDGIYELLDELKKLDINLAVLSNKPHEFTVSYVNHFFKNYNFKEIHGQKKRCSKKNQIPKAALDIVKCLDSSCENTYFIGDTKIDMQTAKKCKYDCNWCFMGI